jgi:hypothetical protein
METSEPDSCHVQTDLKHANLSKSGFTFFFTTTDGRATDYGLDYRGDGVRVSVLSRIFSSPYRPDLGYEAHPASYPMGAGGSFPGDKAAGA